MRDLSECKRHPGTAGGAMLAARRRWLPAAGLIAAGLIAIGAALGKTC